MIIKSMLHAIFERLKKGTLIFSKFPMHGKTQNHEGVFGIDVAKGNT